jgi:hypothetical protein
VPNSPDGMKELLPHAEVSGGEQKNSPPIIAARVSIGSNVDRQIFNVSGVPRLYCYILLRILNGILYAVRTKY